MEQESGIRRGVAILTKAVRAIAEPYSNSFRISLGPRLQQWLNIPYLTTQGTIAMVSHIVIKEEAQKILIEHNMFDTSKLPEGEVASVKNCPLANVLGGEVDARTLLSLDFLEVSERLILLEFFERFDKGDYPDLIIKKE